MKVAVEKILRSVLGDPYGGPSISRRDGRWVLYSWTDAPSGEKIHAQHEDWTKFVWLCGEWQKTQEKER